MNRETTELRNFNKFLLQILALKNLKRELLSSPDSADVLKMIEELLREKIKVKEMKIGYLLTKYPELLDYAWEFGEIDA